ncbi:hypothetical protein D9758_011585 [Tetrapyrgos nigripes]|uniref:Heterokaryon incompatibility domain-containing protein n=1 Tax=Tetrapyrgos nigripes TaxID=182062 RepID=A0A8H5FQ16_9AGAR|nr:hypothetical protein D9758_011585 [Tetrapyrgos nigripes]
MTSAYIDEGDLRNSPGIKIFKARAAYVQLAPSRIFDYHTLSMRLLNTQTLKLQEFYADIPRYAILSHTWEKEVTFQDIQNLKVAKQKAGTTSSGSGLTHAASNKESSAELSEAINSMYQYYEDAAVCYVYLCDVSIELHPRNPKSTFKDSRWFKRGWTLQELVAPRNVVFLDTDWVRIGTRWTLRDVVSAITSVPVEVFEGRDINTYSVAQRMSWAALRETTRPEDQAYSLMGIFEVSMPPIYGEGGAKAFMRLQQEIIKISDDRSIFAWVAASSEHYKRRGLLARSPYEFRMSGEVKAIDSYCVGDRSSYSFGNNGLRIHLPLETIDDSGRSDDVVLASLLCQSERDYSFLSFYLQKTNQHQYVRCYPDQLVFRPTLQPALSNIQELTVREVPVTRRSRFDTRPSRYGSAVLYHADLLPSARHFLCTDYRPSPVLHSPNSNRVSVQVEPCSSYRIHKLTYKTQVTGEAFTIRLWHYWCTNLPYYTLQLGDRPLEEPPFFIDPSRDDGTVVRTSSGAISVHCEVTGRSDRRLEIDFIDQDSLEIDFWTQTLQPSDSGFIVPSKVDRRLLYGRHDGMFPLIRVYPASLYVKTWQDMAYIPMFPADDGDTTSVSFRILTYGTEDGKSVFHVAIGLLGISSWISWTELVVDKGKKSAEKVYQYYLNRSKADKRRLRQRSAWSDSTHEGGLTASVQERSSLQLGTHLLRLE